MKRPQDTTVEQIVALEFQQFQAVSSRGGRAACQDDFSIFSLMRGSQFQAWPQRLRESYLRDLTAANAAERNLLAEKYAWMMADTCPEEFELIREQLPPLAPTVPYLAAEIVARQTVMALAVCAQFPLTCARGRPVLPDPEHPEITSSSTYLRGELYTYSPDTLALYLEYLQSLQAQGGNLPRDILEETARRYGYAGLEERERSLRGAAI